jgi:hypothetical protein
MKVAIHQPNYLPWLGYFRKIAKCDVFVYFDNVQMPGGKSFVSRNSIKTAQGRYWLTVPVRDKLTTQISDVRISDDRWKRKHLGTLRGAYAKSKWKSIIDELIEPHLAAPHDGLAELNISLIKAIAGYLELDTTTYLRASEMELSENGADSIIEILSKSGATTYVTGSGAGTQRHLDTDGLKQHGIETEFVPNDFAEYQQLHGAFEQGLSILDALLNLGPLETRRIVEGG